LRQQFLCAQHTLSTKRFFQNT